MAFTSFWVLAVLWLRILFFVDVTFLSELWTLEDEGIHSFKTLGINYPLMRRRNLEEQILFSGAIL